MEDINSFYKELNELVKKYSIYKDDMESTVISQIPYKYKEFIAELNSLKKKYNIKYEGKVF